MQRGTPSPFPERADSGFFQFQIPDSRPDKPDLPMTPLNKKRQKIEDALEAAGYPVAEWRLQAEQNRIENPRPRPATRIIEGYSQGIRMVRPGYEEYRPHGRHPGVVVPRCLAKAHHSGKQCGRIATGGAYVCNVHGGRRAGQHCKGADHHWYKGKNESREQRRHRSKASKELKALERLAIQHGVMDVTMRMLGPKPGISWERYIRGREERLAMKRRSLQFIAPCPDPLA